MPRAKVFRDEGDVKAVVKKALKEQGWFYRMPVPYGFGTGGTSDFICLRKGIFIVIETKFGRNKPTTLQWEFICDIIKHGGVGFLVNEVGLPDFLFRLSRLTSTDCGRLYAFPKELIPE